MLNPCKLEGQSTVNAKFLSRLQRLESRFKREQEQIVQIGLLKRLPDDFAGERHVVAVRCQPIATPNWESCEFEERPGPEPPGMQGTTCRIFLTEMDMRL
jgi:hypothetical protein